jgi:hypothetical protein
VPWGAAVAGCRPQAALAPRPVLAAPRQRRQAARRQAHTAAAGSDLGTSLATTAATPDYNLLQQHKVFSAATGAEVALTSEWQAAPGKRSVVALLTHFGDLSSTELAQKLMAILPEVRGVGWGARGGEQAPSHRSTGRTFGGLGRLGALGASASTSSVAACLSSCLPAPGYHYLSWMLQLLFWLAQTTIAHKPCLPACLLCFPPSRVAPAAASLGSAAAGCGSGRDGQGAALCRAAGLSLGSALRRCVGTRWWGIYI